jgi:tetratricopeptide (TPR) repeat protein
MEFAAQKITHSAIDASRFAVPKLPPPKPQPDERLEGLAKARDKAKSQPRDLDTQLELMRAAWAAARFDEAAAAANKAVQLEHSEPEALFILSQIQILQGDLSGALKTLARAKSAGVRPEVATLQQAPVFYRTREYGRLADALDDGGQPTLAGRYRSFAGKPLQPSFAKDACVSRTPLSVVQNLAVVQISIGEQTIPAVLDTGAAELILAKSLSGPLEVSVTTSSTLGPEGPQADFGQTDKIRIGDLTLSNVPIAVMADEALLSLAGEHDEPVRAVVGTGMLTDFQITFDLPKKEFVVIDGRSKCKRQRAEYRKGTATPFYLHEKNYIYVRGSLNGAEGLYLINTGMQGGDMAANQLAYAHAGIGAPVLRSDRTPLVKTGEVRLGEAFSASGLESVYGFFEIQQSGVGFRVDGMLGLGAFENHALTLDFTEQRLYATPSTSP